MLVADSQKNLILTTNLERRLIVDISKLFHNEGERAIVKLENEEKITLALNWWG
jgi:hypothetical protein